jgi:hypothetical protein
MGDRHHADMASEAEPQMTALVLMEGFEMVAEEGLEPPTRGL